MYSERGLEKEIVSTAGRRAIVRAELDWTRLREPLKASIERPRGADSDVLIDPLIEHLDQTVGPATYDIEFVVESLEPAAVSCRLSIGGVVRTGLGDNNESLRGARSEALIDAARMFGVLFTE